MAGLFKKAQASHQIIFMPLNVSMKYTAINFCVIGRSNNLANAQIYTRSDPEYTGRVTVPVLWDKTTDKIVNNESAEIARMFNDVFDDVGAKPGDFYPADLRHHTIHLNFFNA